MRRLLAALAGCLVLAGPALPAHAETPGTLRIEAIDEGAHPDIEMTVVAPSQLADDDLVGDDFIVVEGGRVQRAQAERLDGADQEIVLAIDVSGSMRGAALEAAKDAAMRFVGQAPDGARIAVVAFADRPEIIEPFSDDKDALIAAVDRLELAGNTALYDAVGTAADLFGENPDATQTLVVLTDGADTASAAELDRAGEEMAATGGSFFAVELETSATDRAALARLVAAANGMVVTAEDPSKLQMVFDAVVVDVGNRYRVTYDSQAHGVTDLELGVDAHDVTQRVDGHVLHLPPAPWWKRMLESPAAVAAGLGLGYASLGVLCFVVLAPRRFRDRLTFAGFDGGASALSGLAQRASAAAESSLGLRRAGAALAMSLERAGLRTKPGEFAIMHLSGILAAVALGTLLGSVWFALVLAVLAGFAGKVLLTVLASRRQAAFANQLDDTLQLLSGSLRAGHSLLQAVDAVSREAESPTAEEFRRIVTETRLGRDLSVALDDTAERMTSQDFVWVTQAIAIHREVGGDLAEVLDTVGDTIRERNQIRRQVKALSAEGKLSAIVLLCLPIGVLAFLWLTNPSYLSGFTESAIGYGLLGLAATMMVIGTLWLRKLVHIAF